MKQRVFKTRYFSRWMRKSELSDRMLCAAVDEMAKQEICNEQQT